MNFLTIRGVLFGTVPADPLLTVAILAVVSLFAFAMPAMQAIRLDPMISLRVQ
jgi:hypothetical protein